MALNTVTVTQSYQQIGTGAVTITINVEGKGSLFLNETASDVNALKDHPNVGEQYIQNDAVATHIRTDGDGWVVRVDGAL